MATTRKEKEKILADLVSVLKEAKGLVFADYRGLSVKEMDELRRRGREQGTKVQVAKLTLMRKALQEAGINVDLGMTVPTAVAYSNEDEVTPAKVLAKFAADTKKLELLAGILEGKILGADQVKNLAKLPGRQELLGQLVSVIAGPMRGLVTVFSGTQRNLLYALNAIAEKKSTV